MNTLDVVDYTAYETEAEREEREVAMATGPSEDDWNMFLSDTYVDPAERP